MKQLLKQLREDLQILTLVKEAPGKMKACIKQIEKSADDAFELARHQKIWTDVMENE